MGLTKYEITQMLQVLQTFALLLVEQGYNWDDDRLEEREFRVVVDRLKLALKEFEL